MVEQEGEAAVAAQGGADGHVAVRRVANLKFVESLNLYENVDNWFQAFGFQIQRAHPLRRDARW